MAKAPSAACRHWRRTSAAPQQRGGFGAPLLPETHIDVDRAVALAIDGADGVRLAAIFVPSRQSGTWRVQLHGRNDDGLSTVLIDDRTGTVRSSTPLSGDRIAQWIRWIHEGSHSGAPWQFVVFLCGVLPAVFSITGLLIWLRSRKSKTLARRDIAAVPRIDAAE